ncbi:MAG: methylmalonyl Co-A mutase-associated GTPase MeaB, partial [Myxococcota bacterium]
KSTLTSELIRYHRAQGLTVGVVAVDPSSPFTGGAILGDRIRMQDHFNDPGVFIRSLATRGAMGGLSASTADVINVMEAMGKQIILVETVGVGQDEVDIVKLADTTLVVTVPGLGDDVQAIKAGILEIADVFVVNKADREGADRTVRELEMMLHLRENAAARVHADAHVRGESAPGTWDPPVVRTVAIRGQGVQELMEAVHKHQAFLKQSGGLTQKKAERARRSLLAMAQQRLLASALEVLQKEGGLEPLVQRVASRQSDPHAEVTRWMTKVLKV